MPIEKIASWRDNKGQIFYDERALQSNSIVLNIPLTPRIGIDILPIKTHETFEWMKTKITKTQAQLDSDAIGKPEGIVVRLPDRSAIAKLRFENYERTFR
jgi:hypothetical protein